MDLDVVSGIAGAIPILLEIGAEFGIERHLESARDLGRQLILRANKRDEGWSWSTLPGATADPTGFSHGASGFAWALLELFLASGDPEFRTAAEHALRYERHHYSHEHQNWPDFRPDDVSGGMQGAAPRYMVAWCHGAPGIGLARARAWQILDDPALRQELEAAVRTTAMTMNGLVSSPANFSLCHGMSGNADFLLVAAEVLREPALGNLARQVGTAGIRLYHETRAPWPCGVLNGGETPGLMLGLAGIGYFYLRLQAPKSVPSMLMVHPHGRA